MVSVKPVSFNSNIYTEDPFAEFSFSNIKTQEEEKDDPINALLDVRETEADMHEIMLASVLKEAQDKHPSMHITR